MHVDHLIHAAGPAGLAAEAQRLAGALGAGWTPGGEHPSWGTRNAVIPLAGLTYLEVVEVADPAVAAGTAFGSAVAARCDGGGGWLGWVVAVDDVDAVAAGSGQVVAAGTRRRPDGSRLHWRTLGVEVLRTDPDLPFLITWDVPAALHPSAGAGPVPRLSRVEVAGDVARLAGRLGGDPQQALDGVRVEVRPPEPGTVPGLRAASFDTAAGRVRVPS